MIGSTSRSVPLTNGSDILEPRAPVVMTFFPLFDIELEYSIPQNCHFSPGGYSPEYLTDGWLGEITKVDTNGSSRPVEDLLQPNIYITSIVI